MHTNASNKHRWGEVRMIPGAKASIKWRSGFMINELFLSWREEPPPFIRTPTYG